MALTVYTNVNSLIAQNYVNQTSSNISKNLEKLSSGLRINSAADDASGLAISEKLRGQISGLKRASSNAQDGISMLQTAEGGLATIQSMTQRMRELAVQASNGVYTSNDRAEIQKEVDQLKEEIDRVASSTEFNTKKLLNGNATALWSTDKGNSIDVAVTGKVAEGNYNLEVTVDPGKNYVYKSDVMTLNSDAVGGEIVEDGAAGDNDSNVTSVTDIKTMATSGTSYYTVNVGDVSANTSATMTVTGSYQQAGSSFSVATAATVSTATSSGYVEVKFDQDVTAGATAISAKIRFINAKTGDVGDWVTVTAAATGSTISISSADTVALTDTAGGTLGFDMTISLGVSGKIQSGDKVLLAQSGAVTTADSIASSGGGTIKISDGPSGQAGPTINFTTASSLTKKDNGDDVVDANNVTVYYASIDSGTGNIDVGSMTLNFKEGSNATDANGLTKTDSFNLEVRGGGEAATSSTKLRDIALFTTSDGRNLFDQTQELTIFGNGSSKTIYLEGDDTVSDFETKMTDAIKALGMGATSETSDVVSDVNNNLVNYVSTETDNTNEALKGSFVIQTAKLGNDSQLSFVGDENLINALSLATIQEGENSELTIKVTDAHTGNTVGSDKVNDYTLKNVIAGVEVKVDSALGLDITWDDTNKEMTFNAGTAEDIKLHLVDNSTELQIGANEGQTINTSIAQADTYALGLSDVLMVDQESAQKSITMIDSALNKISSARATIGAQINRLDYTIAGLDTTRENLTASESRIRDLDMASEMSDFTKNQILSQAGVAMISQANAQSQLALQLLG
ncbi:flagellin [Seleniivibrio woodruffii]|uniref:Flagellin n=1 Tax=Seleniivibrio woodruffii TaxID=1078050 RepID=A0A4R1KD18_9BACT|nr:flagellin [Seleniivibrio woodruffii]TCK62466.1 flagellin [Seleniivibrio woodruffii]TVZ37107.1 flagellin [Seleniivibrio woodruffii]